MSKRLDTITKAEQKLLEDILESSISKLESPELTHTFFYKILTEGERISISRRLLVATLIQRGDTYMEVNERLNISPNTFAHIRKWLTDMYPDYNSIIKEIRTKQREKEIAKLPKDFGAPFSYKRMKQKYPAHFLLFTLTDEILKKIK